MCRQCTRDWRGEQIYIIHHFYSIIETYILFHLYIHVYEFAHGLFRVCIKSFFFPLQLLGRITRIIIYLRDTFNFVPSIALLFVVVRNNIFGLFSKIVNDVYEYSSYLITNIIYLKKNDKHGWTDCNISSIIHIPMQHKIYTLIIQFIFLTFELPSR